MLWLINGAGLMMGNNVGDLTKHLSRHEFACKCGCGFAAADFELVNALEECVKHFEAEAKERLFITIRSGCRCEAHNRAVKGSINSMHRFGIAADFYISGISPDDVAAHLDARYPNRCGIGRYIGRTHLDMRAVRARWDER